MNWRSQAECRKHDPDIMGGELAQLVVAKQICAPCPVRRQCLDWAIRHDEQWGVWGGLDRRERRRFQRIGTIAICHVHGVYYVSTCFQCLVDIGEERQPHSTKTKVGGRREQITEWVEQGYKDTEIARMISAEIGERVATTTVTKARNRWGIVRVPRHDMAEVHAVYSRHIGFARLTRPEKESLWRLWAEDGRSKSEFQKVFHANWDTVRSLAEAAARCPNS